MTKPNKGDVYNVHLDNQMPRIGSGFRIVEIVSFGWKWVKVKTIHPDERLVFKQRVSRKVWDKLKKNARILDRNDGYLIK